MSKRAEEAQASAILPESIISYAKEHTVLAGLVYREGVKFGYEQAAKEVMKQIHKYLARRLIANREEIGLSTYAAGRTEEDKLIMDYIEKLEKEYE